MLNRKIVKNVLIPIRTNKDKQRYYDKNDRVLCTYFSVNYTI